MKRHIKVFTYIDRYNIFLDIWMNYYTSFITPTDIVIMYRNSSGFNLQQYLDVRGWSGVEVIEVPTSSNQMVNANLFSEVQINLLRNSDVVLYSDIDEIIFHKDLLKLLDTFTAPYLTTIGFEIVQNLIKEDVLDTSTNILKQRKYGKFSKWYDKSVVLREAVHWEDGKHSNNTAKNTLEGLYLVHLNKVDIDLLQETNTQTSYYYSTGVFHNLIKDKSDIIMKYELDRYDQLVPIPEDILMYLELNAVTLNEIRNNHSNLPEIRWNDSNIPKESSTVYKRSDTSRL